MSLSSRIGENAVPSCCCVTVDVESDWGGRACPEQDVEGCRYALPRILTLFDFLGVRATFFISSAVVKAVSSELREITSQGHEIASHGWNHRRYDRLDFDSLTLEVQRSREMLQDSTGFPIKGFRSPCFALNRDLFHALAHAGYEYDSSLVAGCLPGRYSNRIANKPFCKDGILEIPVGRIPFTPFPNGLLWMNFGGAAFPPWWLPTPHNTVEVFYFHPFDLYPAKYNPNFGWKINLWYLLRNKHASRVLENYLKRVAKRSRFLQMHDLLMFDWVRRDGICKTGAVR